MARLILSTPDGQRTVELRAKNSLGRHPDNSIQLLDKIVSKEHCLIEVRGGKFILKDLGSLNGTYVSGQRVNGEIILSEGAEIAMGQTTGKIEGVDQLPAPTPSAHWDHPTAAMQPGQVAPRASSQAVSPPQAFRQASTPMTTPEAIGARVVQAASAAVPPSRASGSPPSSSRRIGMKTRVDLSDQARAIGTQIDATQKGFLPFDQLARDPMQLSQDYERLRLSHELAREIALERDLDILLDKILETIFRFVRADRGVILLQSSEGLAPAASYRRDGTDRPIPVSSTIMNHVVKERATVLTHDAAMDFAASKGKSMILNNISSAIVAPLLHDDEILGVLWLDSESLAQFQQKDLEIVTAIANQAAMFIEINILGKKIEQEVVNRERFSRLLSPNVAEKVLSGELEVKKGGRLVNGCTVFNSDIRGFTAMSERVTPQEIVDMLNEYFELMVETIFKYEGTLDKFMGDGLMALWGAPVVHPDDAIRSVECALEQIQVLEQYNQERVAAGKGRLDVGFGVHTGPLVAGYIGSSKALSYTVIGDTANTSARLCGIATPGQIVVSETTLEQLRGKFKYEELPPASLKNKEKPFRCFNVTGHK
jgi:adenylate cyclase